ncbi:MAG: SLC13/DASS family transporter [Campylobacteraceae bacterium]|nr:SLC13/DASS family transporter [Campylobacteraceae bacterium]
MNKIFISFLLSFLLSFITFFIANLGFNIQHSLLISIVVFLVTLWTNEGLPLGVVSLLPILLFPIFDIASTNATTSNYSKSIIFLFLGGFMLAIATQKIDLHKVIAHKLLAIFPSTPRGVMYSLSITAALLSSLIANTTTALLLVPIALYLTDDLKLKMRLVLAVAYGASMGGIITPIGTAPNLLLLGFLETNALQSISFIKWMALTVPLAAVMLLIMPYILSIGVNKIKFDFDITDTSVVNKEQKRLIYILLGLVVVLLLNSSIEPYYSGLGLNEKGILLGFGLLMFIPNIGFLEWEDTKKIPYEIIFLFGAGFSIAMAFSSTGLANEIATRLLAITSFSTLFLILITATLITFTTEITSNTALISIALPIIYSLAQASNIDITLLLMVATICASYAFMLPIATPPNAIAMSSGVVKVKDMASIGFVFNVLGIITITCMALIYWRFYL